jgi:uncharacterized protein YkwD
MYMAERFSSIALVIMTLGAHHLGAEGPDVRLGEPPFRLVQEHLGGVEPAEPDRSAAVVAWSRSAVVNFFNNEYTPPFSVPMGWTGNVGTCAAGTTSQAYLDATFQLINFYRGMAGLVDVTNATSYNAGAQEAALIMSANGALSHSPPPSWTCWTSDGAAAAGSSNLALGNAGPNAIVAFIRDSGTFNYFTGHRRWILYPRLNQFGTGSVGETTTAANALYVFTGYVPRPATPANVAWPPEGYVPYQVVYPRWSFSINTSSSVDFASANVTMTEDGSPVSLTVVSRTDNGYGDNTIVWEPTGLIFTPGAQDRTFSVTVSNIMAGGSPQTEVYNVVVIDPLVVTDLIFTDGFESGSPGLWSQTVP